MPLRTTGRLRDAFSPLSAGNGRYLTADEKAREVASFTAYRRDPANYRTAHHGAVGGEGWIDPEVTPLVDGLNELEGVCTVQSCCGHRHPVPDDADGAERVHNGQLWLRLSEDMSRRFEQRVGSLLAQDVIVHVQKLYSYQGMTEPHEVVDVQFRDGSVEDAERVILGFFRGLVSANGT